MYAMLSLGEMSAMAEVLWDRREKATQTGGDGEEGVKDKVP